MSQYILRRLLLAIPVLVGIIFVTFTLARLIPGDPCRAQLGERATDELCDAFDARYGLDKPIVVQFGIYMTDVLKGDLGESIRFGKPVTTLIIERLPMTVELSTAALIFAVITRHPPGDAIRPAPQQHHRCGDHGGGQYWRFHARFLAGVDAGLPICGGSEGNPFLAAALGPTFTRSVCRQIWPKPSAGH